MLCFQQFREVYAAGTPELLVPQCIAGRLMRAKRKRLRDARRYAICNFDRCPDTVRRLLLASHVGRSRGSTHFRTSPSRRWGAKRATHRRGFSGTCEYPRTYPRAASWGQWLEPGSRLLPAGGRRRLAGRQQHANGRRLEPARTRRLRALRCGADRPSLASEPRAGRVAALLLTPALRGPNCFNSYRAFPEAQSQKAFGSVNPAPIRVGVALCTLRMPNIPLRAKS